MVLFVTGICPRECWYCPLSERRRDRDHVYANERRVDQDEEVLGEARLMNALGTGITGGEPLTRLERAIHYIRLLKEEFGPEHHVHLYTSQAPDLDTLTRLREAGLDEIRFHPPPDRWEDPREYEESLRVAMDLGLEAGVEVPCLEGVQAIARMVDRAGGFLNLNELEFSDTNATALHQRDYEPTDDSSCGARGSREVARSVECERMHFCSSRFKDAVQLRRRFKRIAQNTRREFDEVTEDGTLVYGVIEGPVEAMESFGVPPGFYVSRNDRVETAWWLLEELREDLQDMGVRSWVEERHPMPDGLVVERTPITGHP